MQSTSNDVAAALAMLSKPLPGTLQLGDYVLIVKNIISWHCNVQVYQLDPTGKKQYVLACFGFLDNIPTHVSYNRYPNPGMKEELIEFAEQLVGQLTQKSA